jgi:hypothetical protein
VAHGIRAAWPSAIGGLLIHRAHGISDLTRRRVGVPIHDPSEGVLEARLPLDAFGKDALEVVVSVAHVTGSPMLGRFLQPGVHGPFSTDRRIIRVAAEWESLRGEAGLAARQGTERHIACLRNAMMDT